MARILIIDDEAQVLDVVQHHLVKAQHEVLTAQSPGEGLDLYRTYRPDLVLTDIFMPNVGGLTVLMEVARDAKVRVIAMSGGGSRGLVEVLDDAPAFGAWRVLKKPFTRAELLAAVDEALR
jgi:CheY-like chemotaxis protein